MAYNIQKGMSFEDFIVNTRTSVKNNRAVIEHKYCLHHFDQIPSSKSSAFFDKISKLQYWSSTFQKGLINSKRVFYVGLLCMFYLLFLLI